MNLKNRPPVFVPTKYRTEIEKLSKAALMDIAWDLATRCAVNNNAPSIAEELRATAQIIQIYRDKSFHRK